MDLQHLSWPFFEPFPQELAEGLRAWAVRELQHRFEREGVNPDGLARELVAELGRAGWLRYCVPAPYGRVGPGLDARSEVARGGLEEVVR